MVQFHSRKQALVGQAGSLRVSDKDEATRKLAMLIEGECDRRGLAAVERFVAVGVGEDLPAALAGLVRVAGAVAVRVVEHGARDRRHRTLVPEVLAENHWLTASQVYQDPRLHVLLRSEGPLDPAALRKAAAW